MIIDFYNGGGGGGNTYTKQEVDAMVALLFDNAAYVSSSHTINFYHGSTVLASIDATDFIKDGMVDSVSIETISGVKYLVITFNTEAGKEDIQIPLSDIFDPDLYYTKTQVDALLSAITASIEELDEVTANAINDLADHKQDALTAGANITISGNVISATDTTYQAGSGITISGNTISADVDLSNYYTKSEVDTIESGLTAAIQQVDRVSAQALNDLVNKVDGKQEKLTAGANIIISGTTISATADPANYYTKSQIDSQNATLTAAIQQVDRVSAQALNDLADQIGDINTILASI